MAILEVIKSEAPNGLLVWKHPAEDFNTMSTLIVDESQIALFYKNGQIADIFPAGRYVLSTNNIPLLRKLIQLPTGGVSPFSCRVYFVNMAEAMNMKWGLNSRITYMEPVYNIPLELGARGTMSVSVADPASLILRLVGTETSLTAESLVGYFRSLIVMYVKSHLARAIRDRQLSIFELNGPLAILAAELKSRISPELEPYGFRLNLFTVDEVLLPEDNPAFLRVKRALSERSTGIFEAQTKREQAIIAADASANVEVIKARGHAEALNVQGTSYREERQLNIAESLANNPNAGQFSGMAADMAMMGGAMAMGVQTARTMTEAMSPMGGYAVPGFQGYTAQNNVNVQAAYAAAPQPQAQPGTPMQPASPVQAQPGGIPMQPASAVPSGTKKCVNCGAELPIKAKFCLECGQTQPLLCPNCGAVLPDGAKFCLECGTRIV